MPRPADDAATPMSQRRQSLPDTPVAFPRTGGELRTSFTAVRDTFSRRHHSLDFAYSHAHYLRNRVLAMSVIFLLLTPLWALVDAAMLPAEVLGTTLSGRALLMAGLLGVLLLARSSRERIARIRLSAGLLLALPALFYALVLILLPPGGTDRLAGYAFIPFLLVATLSVFPFTILESLAACLALLGLQAFAQRVDGSWLTPTGLEGLWLLCSLGMVSMAANHFQLGLLMRVYRQATHDPLTGLFNRGALKLYLDKLQAWRHQEHSRGASPDCVVLMMDIDHFKGINDTHGHSVGDRVLADFARVLEGQTRTEDRVARYGGEEFVVLLVNTDGHQARQIAERIRQAVESHPFLGHEQQRVAVTTSIGVAPLGAEEAPQQALERADAALYRAKEAGRNRIMCAGLPTQDTAA
ncbi:MAG: diguanylate cyclase [Pseudomonadota bacterium]